jgi:signal transduction histidine kinase
MANIDAILESEHIEELDKKPFSVMARIALQLGRESISNSITAIIELVKNSYDADAEKVEISFSGLKINKKAQSGTAYIVIDDDGNGMTYKELVNNWLVIGTTNKLRSPVSEVKNRVLTGEKGLGRLGLDRLCKKTILRTFTDVEPDGTELVIDWEKYEKFDDALESIKHDLYRVPKKVVDPILGKTKKIKKGTQLILFGLKDIWNDDYLKQLKNELTLLVSPFAGINDFSIFLNSGIGLKDIDGKIGSEYMLEAADWIVDAKIFDDGKLSYSMVSSSLSSKYELPITAWKKRFKDAVTDIPKCGPLKFELYFFPRKEVTVSDLTLSRRQIDDFLEANQGIRIYRDNFRVKPYGEPDGSGDWLRLSYKRQQSPSGVTQDVGSWRVGYNQVVGAVFLTRENNSNLVDQTNREGIVEGEGFFDLTRFAEDVIRFFEINRQKYEIDHKNITQLEVARKKAKKSTDASATAVKKLIGLTKKVEGKSGKRLDPTTIEDLSVAANDVAQKVEKAQQDQANFVTVFEQVKQELQSQKDTLGNLASLGILAHTFGHETLASSNLVATNAKYLNDDIKNGIFMVTPDMRARLDDELETIIYESSKIENFAKFTIGNVRRDNRNRTKVLINDVIIDVFKYFEKTLAEKSIVVDLTQIPRSGIPAIWAFRIDWESILINFIANSVWALSTIPVSNRKIRVSLKLEELGKEERYIKLSFGDSGIGIASGTEDQIFLPTFSTRRNNKGEVIGTGMGLAIVKGFISSYDKGEITVTPNSDLGGAEFHITLRVPEVREKGQK